MERDGDPWWVAKDVCDVLELSNPRSTLALLDEDEKGVQNLNTLGGNQSMTIINEPGLYSLILRSRKPEAKAFKRWITHEVIPAIRKHGRRARTLNKPYIFIWMI
nr:Bro-N domain-containing protein [Cloacibacillus porcorum]